MAWFTALLGWVAPVFLVMSPVLSYSDQAVSMQRNKTSAGFSLDIPLIMLIASFFRIAYWPGARFDTALLIQSIIMVGMQVVLLRIALDHRPGPSTKGGEAATPFAGAQEGSWMAQRPYNFWQWRSPKPYWQFLGYVVAGLIVAEILLTPVPGIYAIYSTIIGITGLSVEATLPIPQILSNHQSRSCKGFRLSVLASWLIGDAMKIFWFFTATSEIPWAFKICGIFQASCDTYLGVQYWMYGDGVGSVTPGSSKGYEMVERGSPNSWRQSGHVPTRSLTPTRRPAPFTAGSSQ
ncbi:hypothetical protein NLU13_1919 [Sarocladium strictum]|uniref:PQ loop repeat protein n=1 Tax=Sarocladium strictum TaxID=5046 RepID=A0AA39GTT7_SARSR|nr:hypothetical protein NLU13_1919 [Sarocladium strictum]